MPPPPPPPLGITYTHYKKMLLLFPREKDGWLAGQFDPQKFAAVKRGGGRDSQPAKEEEEEEEEEATCVCCCS